MSILPSSPMQQRPAAGRSFGAIVAAETLADAEAWIAEVGGVERRRRLDLVADMLIAAHPETDPVEAEDVDQDAAADLAVETLIVQLADAEEKRAAAREPRVYPETWYTKTKEGRAVAAASPFRNGPRYVTRSGRTGKPAPAGTAVRS